MFQVKKPLDIKAFQTTGLLTANAFPIDANVRISIAGLAFCTLNTKLSKVNFLRHVPHHDLFMGVIQKRRDSVDPISYSVYKMNSGQNLSITSDTSEPSSIEADRNSDEYELKEIVNLFNLHGKRLKRKNPAPTPSLTILSIHNCAFYTLKLTEDVFQIIETVNDVPTTTPPTEKTIGFIMAGKMSCDIGGKTIITSTGTINTKIELPQNDEAGEFLYDISFTNHCFGEMPCKDLMKNDSDFRFYYQLLEDPDKPGRKFKLKKKNKLKKTDGRPKTVDVGACNVVIECPPIPDISPLKDTRCP